MSPVLKKVHTYVQTLNIYVQRKGNIHSSFHQISYMTIIIVKESRSK